MHSEVEKHWLTSSSWTLSSLLLLYGTAWSPHWSATSCHSPAWNLQLSLLATKTGCIRGPRVHRALDYKIFPLRVSVVVTSINNFMVILQITQNQPCISVSQHPPVSATSIACLNYHNGLLFGTSILILLQFSSHRINLPYPWFPWNQTQTPLPIPMWSVWTS